MLSSITIDKLKEMLGTIQIIDIRSVEKFNNNHIPTSKHIPMDKLLLYPKKYLNFEDHYYFYCEQGIQSIKLCLYLQKQGYKVHNIQGGYEAWIMSN